jgi:RND family efflux transporter MFP subunit
MRTRTLFAVLALVAAGAGAVLWKGGHLERITGTPSAPRQEPAEKAPESQAPPVTIAVAKAADFVELVHVTGSLVAREEIMVAPEVEGLKVLSLNADEGDRVAKGAVLAVLVAETLDAQLAQSDASIARADASIARARSQIAEAEARLAEADASLARARPLLKSDYLSESVFDERQAAARASKAQLEAAKDGLRLAEAEKAQALAQRRELDWRRGNTEVRAPVGGVVSRRSARIGSIAAGAGEPMFRIIAEGEVELDAEVPEARLARIAVGQTADVETSAGTRAAGKVRLVSPEVDRTTRLGRVRVFIGDNPALKIGSFARATIEGTKRRGIAVPQSAVLYRDAGPAVLVVEAGRVKLTRIETGLATQGFVEVLSGLSPGAQVVAKSGTFLRDGDAVRPVEPQPAMSEVR